MYGKNCPTFSHKFPAFMYIYPMDDISYIYSMHYYKKLIDAIISWDACSPNQDAIVTIRGLLHLASGIPN